jgi:hypothetical protein
MDIFSNKFKHILFHIYIPPKTSHITPFYNTENLDTDTDTDTDTDYHQNASYDFLSQTLSQNQNNDSDVFL